MAVSGGAQSALQGGGRESRRGAERQRLKRRKN